MRPETAEPLEVPKRILNKDRSDLKGGSCPLGVTLLRLTSLSTRYLRGPQHHPEHYSCRMHRGKFNQCSDLNWEVCLQSFPLLFWPTPNDH